MPQFDFRSCARTSLTLLQGSEPNRMGQPSERAPYEVDHKCEMVKFD